MKFDCSRLRESRITRTHEIVRPKLHMRENGRKLSETSSMIKQDRNLRALYLAAKRALKELEHIFPTEPGGRAYSALCDAVETIKKQKGWK